MLLDGCKRLRLSRFHVKSIKGHPEAQQVFVHW